MSLRVVPLVAAIALLSLSACAPARPPAPVEYRGVGAGETSPTGSTVPAYASDSARYGVSPAPYSSSSGVQSGTLAPPNGYAAPASSAPISVTEINDPYAQAARSTPATASTATATTPFGAASAPPTVNATYTQTPQPAAPTPPMAQVQPSAAPAYPAAQPPKAVGAQNTITGANNTVASAADVLKPATAQQLGTGDFGWPVRGRLISGYGAQPNGQKNEGYNIAVPLGSPVYAAKDGTVAYAGNEIRSFGNMVLIKHVNGMFTVYGHLDRIEVQKGQSINRGQVVGTAGQSGGVSEPQVHFEVRRGSTPLDPSGYLSR